MIVSCWVCFHHLFMSMSYEVLSKVLSKKDIYCYSLPHRPVILSWWEIIFALHDFFLTNLYWLTLISLLFARKIIWLLFTNCSTIYLERRVFIFSLSSENWSYPGFLPFRFPFPHSLKMYVYPLCSTLFIIHQALC